MLFRLYAQLTISSCVGLVLPELPLKKQGQKYTIWSLCKHCCESLIISSPEVPSLASRDLPFFLRGLRNIPESIASKQIPINCYYSLYNSMAMVFLYRRKEDNAIKLQTRLLSIFNNNPCQQLTSLAWKKQAETNQRVRVKTSHFSRYFQSGYFHFTKRALTFVKLRSLNILLG